MTRKNICLLKRLQARWILMELRNYQNECLTAILENYQSGIRRQLVCLPTGTGKTVIFARFPRFFKMKRKMLVLAHRFELLEQARNKLLNANPRLNIEIEQAEKKATQNSDIVIASVPTLGRKNSKRLLKLDPDDFSIVVVDEAHHATADTYIKILEHFKLADKADPKLLVGFTATPKRSDGQGLSRVFDKIVYSRNMPDMIHNGYLSPVTGYRIETDIDLSRVKTRMGDFVTSQLSGAVNIEQRNKLVVKVFRERLPERQTVVFCVDVAHAKNLAASFKKANIYCESVTGDMIADERRRVLSDFSAGKIQVVTNCMVLTEGFDEPSIDGIILARPTKSSLLYTQMIGRGTRLHPGKKNVTVIDIVDLSHKHTLVTLPSLFGLAQHFDLKGKTTADVERAIRWVERHRPWVRTDLAKDIDDLRYRCKHIDLFELQLPPELMGYASFAWTATGLNSYRLCFKKDESLTCQKTLLDCWEVILRSTDKNMDGCIVTTDTYLEKAVQTAEKYVRETHQDAIKLVNLNARWRRQPASDKQLALIKSKGIIPDKNLTRGQASHLISILTIM